MIRIRSAELKDVTGVLPMVRSICALHERWEPGRYAVAGDPGERYGPWLMQRAVDGRAVFLVAEREGETAGEADRLVGFLIATSMQEMPIYRLREYGFIHDVWVEEGYRNEGIARQMTMLAVERFREMGLRQVRLDMWAGNTAALKLYESCGFHVSTTQMLLEMQ